MAKDDDDDDSLPPLGENCDKFLDQAKKGQPRSFLLVCKGNKVKYLAVKKKPVKSTELVEARKSGYKGDGYFGVITGKGMDLVFNLSTEDGYTAEPCKDKSLKDFLEEHAGFKCKPTFAIVSTAPAIPFDEDDLKNPLISRFMAMGEQISNVLDVRPEAEAELTKTVTAIRLLLQDVDFTTAEPLVNALAARLQELISGGQSAAPAATTAIPAATPATPAPTPVESSQPTPTADNEVLKNKLQEALNKLVPQLKQAVATYPDKKVELLTPVAQIKKQMDAGELQEAKQGILAVGQLLKSVMAQGRTQPQAQPGTDLRVEYQRKLAALQPNYDRVLREMLGDTSKFRTVMAYVTEQAGAEVYGNAIKALERLGQAIEQAIAAGAKETATKLAPGGEDAPGKPPEQTIWDEMTADWRQVRDGRELVTALMEADDRMGNRLSDLCERGDQTCDARQDLAAAQETLKQLQAMILASQRPDATPEDDPGEWDEVASQWQKIQSSANLIWAVEKTKYANQISDLIERGEVALAARTDLWTLRDVLARLEDSIKQAVDDAGGVAEWRSYVMDAIKDLRKLQASIRRTEHRAAAEVADRFNDVIARLRIEPQSRQDVQELETFIRDSDTITRAEKKNPLGVDVQVREPLLAALQRVANSLPA